jgi:hypothetical protein
MKYGLFFLLYITELFSASILHNTFNDGQMKGDVKLSSSSINVTFTSNAIPRGRMIFNYITNIHPANFDAYNQEQSDEKIDKGITILGLHYNGFEKLSLQSYYYYDPRLYGIFITQTDYTYGLSNNYFLTLGTQYLKSINDGELLRVSQSEDYEGIDFFALRTAVEGKNWGIDLNYSRNYGLTGIQSSYNGLANIYTVSMIAGGHGNYQPETWMLKSRYTLSNFMPGEDELAMWLSSTRTNDSRGDEYDAYYLHWQHTVKRNTSVFIRYENLNFKDDKDNIDYLKVFAGYTF